MESVYQQVEDAIARNLHLGAPRHSMSMHGMHWHYPVGIEHGDIVMRDSDCGLAKPTFTITTTEWAERVEKYGLWRMVGGWDFARADDPAADLTRFCHRNPSAAGQRIYELEQEINRLKSGAA